MGWNPSELIEIIIKNNSESTRINFKLGCVVWKLDETQYSRGRAMGLGGPIESFLHSSPSSVPNGVTSGKPLSGPGDHTCLIEEVGLNKL